MKKQMLRVLTLALMCLMSASCLAASIGGGLKPNGGATPSADPTPVPETDPAKAAYDEALMLLDAGGLPEAQQAFRELGSYEDSAYYFYYVSARLYEQQGNPAAAMAIYNLTPEFLDCSERLLALANGTGSGGAEATPAPVADIDFPTYHEFADVMPMQFDDYSKTEAYYVIYYAIDSDETISAYGKLFTDAGWKLVDLSSNSNDGWKELYYVNPANDAVYFGIQYNVEEGYTVLMYLSDVDYGFDPAEGLR